MWIVVSTKVKTERVAGGRQLDRHCSECGEDARFYERRATSILQLYFIDVVDYGRRTVMACGACGALYATDELGEPVSADTQNLGNVTAAAERAGKDLAARAKVAFGEIAGAARRLTGQADAPSEAASDETDAHPDPLAEDDAALEARFAELDRKFRVKDE